MKRAAPALAALVLAVASGSAWAADAPPVPSCAFRPGFALAAHSDSTVDSSHVTAGDSAAAPTGAAAPARVASRYHAPDSTLVEKLRSGGYVIVFRHGKTDWAQRDAAIVNFAQRSEQRNLSEEGRKESGAVGAAMAELHIPIGAVLTSPMWRCRDTGLLAFGRADTTIDLFQKGRKSREERLRLLSTPPSVGTNLVLVTHQDVLLPIMKLKRDELGEGEALIVRPLGAGAFEVLAQASAADWIRFARSRKL